MKFKLFYIPALLVCFLAGCTSQRLTEQNKDIAVKNAQEFIFDNINDISLHNRRIIQYTYPRILKNEIFLSRGQEFNQYYFAWDLTDPKVTIMVYGTSRKDLDEWIPRRILFKEYNEEDYKETSESPGVWSERPSYTDTTYDGNRKAE